MVRACRRDGGPRHKYVEDSLQFSRWQKEDYKDEPETASTAYNMYFYGQNGTKMETDKAKHNKPTRYWCMREVTAARCDCLHRESL